jgi:hypothetical protein
VTRLSAAIALGAAGGHAAAQRIDERVDVAAPADPACLPVDDGLRQAAHRVDDHRAPEAVGE